MGSEQPSTRSPFTDPSTAWGLFKDALVSGQIGAIIGTLALAIIAGQYLGLIESPMVVAHKSILDTARLNSKLLLSNQEDIIRIDVSLNKLTNAMWAVCFVQASTPDTKAICKEGMMRQRD